MNEKLCTIGLILSMFALMPSICFSRQKADTTVLQRVWDYKRNFSQSTEGTEQNLYLRYTFHTERRNSLLFLVPTMYTIAKGDRQYIGEAYCKLRRRDAGRYELNRQVIYGTIPRQRKTMPAMLDLMTPDCYATTLYRDFMLSPFHKANRHLYKYVIAKNDDGDDVIHFWPRKGNTQLVTGMAIANDLTGRLEYVRFEGEFDMIKFKVTATMDREDTQSLLPDECTTEATFKFMGNRIKAMFKAVYNCEQTLPDSISERVDPVLMRQLRPDSLSPLEKELYAPYEQKQLARQQATPDTTKHHNLIKEIFWDAIGENLFNSHKADAGPLSMRMSPLLNPLYMGYSPHKGISYKLKFGARYAWNQHRYLTFNPRLGYNFRLHQFYYQAPLRMTYNPKRNGYAEVTWANGNRISNDVLAGAFAELTGDSLDMPDFKDEYIKAINNIVAFDWLEFTAGVVYHRRRAVSRRLMTDAGLPGEYRSFAPTFTLRLTPWAKGPTLTANFEQSFKNVLNSNLSYQRWELDAAYKCRMRSLHTVSTRIGTGFYTHRSSNYFVDFANFRDENLPQGWDDEWTGQFQLLKSRWYNESDHYLRGHLSYESPMMALTRLPRLGRFIETERIYLSALSIDHTRPYYEMGYGFTTRLFSAGLFASLLNAQVKDFGCKFTIELFHRW